MIGIATEISGERVRIGEVGAEGEGLVVDFLVGEALRAGEGVRGFVMVVVVVVVTVVVVL